MLSYLPLLVSLVAVDLLAAMTPGPNFVLVTQMAMQRTRPAAAAVVLGLTTANLLWCLAVVFGLSTVFALAPWLYGAIKILGGAYLIYLGVRLWRSAGNAQSTLDITSKVYRALGTAYFQGLLTNLGNPKSVVYFGSIFTVFLHPGPPIWVQIAAIGIVLFDTIIWYGSVATLFSHRVAQHLYARGQRSINRICGVTMIGFGARLTVVRD